jgi:membrane AbrB-like protein
VSTRSEDCRRLLHWALLISLSVLVAAFLFWLRLPAALLLGPMIVAAILAIRGVRLTVGTTPFHFAQGIIGCLVASSMTPQVVQVFLGNWRLSLSVVVLTLLTTTTISWVMAAKRLLPGTTALWGLSAGAASAMVVLADAHGEDTRLVAFMQYFRAALVATSASLVAGFFGVGAIQGTIDWFPALEWSSLVATGGMVTLAVAIGRWLKLPGGPLLVPMVIGAFINGTYGPVIVLPQWALAVAFAIIGWRVGLAFTRSILTYVARALPAIAAATLLLIAICAGMSWYVAWFAGVDPLTAYLATSPGGLDTISAIAAASRSDMSFVMTFQSIRFLAVVLVAPGLIRFIAKRHIL